MVKLRNFLLFVVIMVAFASGSHLVFSLNKGYCSNPYLLFNGMEEDFCSNDQIGLSECCPSENLNIDSYGYIYDSSNSNKPNNQNDCIINYFSNDTTSPDQNLSFCKKGCCLVNGECKSSSQKYACLISLEGNWSDIFGSACEKEGTGVFPECGSGSSCSSLDQISCKSNGCYWCPSGSGSCMPGCDSCSGLPLENSSSKECIAKTCNNYNNYEGPCKNIGCYYCNGGGNNQKCVEECSGCGNNFLI